MTGYTFRTSGPWGAGKGSNLTPVEVDDNFWQAIQDIEAKAVQGVGIADVIVVGNEFSFVLTDHTILGPYTLPVATFNFRGAWAADITYFVNDIVTNDNAVYLVIFNHVSESVFDPNANDGHGDNFYQLIIDSAFPPDGNAGQFLRMGGSPLIAQWEDAALDDLSDVLISSPLQGQVLQFDGSVWSNAWSPWDFGFSFFAVPAPGTIFQVVPLTRTIVIPADFSGTVGVCDVHPTSDFVISVTLDGVEFGTVTIDVGGAFSFSTSGLDVTANFGQIIRFVAPADSPSPDAADVALTVAARLIG